MTNFTKISALVVGAALLTLGVYSAASPAKDHKPHMQSKHQMMDGEHKNMMQQMKNDHDMMSKMDTSKMDMSTLSSECQTMMTKAKMADTDKGGDAHSGQQGHETAQDHDAKKMQTMMAKHKKCMAEFKHAVPHTH
ncbi:MAG: hypothetical protein COA91_01990 [Robiginitomaculum sp.]|nr:MAG: hypothetical protein COA91_01990 [Robiginitomaculum sp.]